MKPLKNGIWLTVNRLGVPPPFEKTGLLNIVNQRRLKRKMKNKKTED
jgi:hypothetical protein